MSLSRACCSACDRSESWPLDLTHWYGSLNGYMYRDFGFTLRVAPSAGDPVNVLLNIGFSLLYRYLGLMIRQVGLVPSLGFLHTARPGHATLASDRQEPFAISLIGR